VALRDLNRPYPTPLSWRGSCTIGHAYFARIAGVSCYKISPGFFCCPGAEHDKQETIRLENT
jgi:hypothetical protein